MRKLLLALGIALIPFRAAAIEPINSAYVCQRDIDSDVITVVFDNFAHQVRIAKGYFEPSNDPVVMPAQIVTGINNVSDAFGQLHARNWVYAASWNGGAFSTSPRGPSLGYPTGAIVVLNQGPGHYDCLIIQQNP